MNEETQQLAWRRDEVEGIRSSLKSMDIAVSGYGLALDIGGGEGVHAPWLNEMSERLIVSDVTAYSGGERTVLSERFQRNGIPFDPDRVEFHRGDARELIYRDALFDLVVSINAFEHIPEPERAFGEAIRVTRPGGTMVLHFDPIWNSPLGHHLPHLDLAPWQHVVESEADFIASIGAAGGNKDDVLAFQTMMNRTSYAAFMAMLTGPLSGAFSFTHIQRWPQSVAEEPRSAHPNFARARALGYSDEDLFVRGLRFFGVKA